MARITNNQEAWLTARARLGGPLDDKLIAACRASKPCRARAQKTAEFSLKQH